jgi:hypothetical protein
MYDTLLGVKGRGSGSDNPLSEGTRKRCDALATTFVPFTPELACDNGDTSPWEYSAFTFLVRRNGADVTFLTTSRLDTFLVATLSGSTMTGRIGTRFYTDGTFQAERRSGADPNLEPGILTVFTNGRPFHGTGDRCRVGQRHGDCHCRERHGDARPHRAMRLWSAKGRNPDRVPAFHHSPYRMS